MSLNMTNGSTKARTAGNQTSVTVAKILIKAFNFMDILPKVCPNVLSCFWRDASTPVFYNLIIKNIHNIQEILYPLAKEGAAEEHGGWGTIEKYRCGSHHSLTWRRVEQYGHSPNNVSKLCRVSGNARIHSTKQDWWNGRPQRRSSHTFSGILPSNLYE